MKKQTCFLMLIGALCMGFPIFTRSFMSVPESVSDFLKGFGVAFIISAFIMEIRRKQSCKTNMAGIDDTAK